MEVTFLIFSFVEKIGEKFIPQILKLRAILKYQLYIKTSSIGIGLNFLLILKISH